MGHNNWNLQAVYRGSVLVLRVIFNQKFSRRVLFSSSVYILYRYDQIHSRLWRRCQWYWQRCYWCELVMFSFTRWYSIDRYLSLLDRIAAENRWIEGYID